MITWHQSDTATAAKTIAAHTADGMLNLDEEGNSPPQFPVCEKWNKCMALCLNDGLQIPCDAFVRATDENFISTFQNPPNLLELAGQELREELRRLGDCPTGDVRITGAFGLEYAKRIIHAVPPLYSHNFHTASLSALHSVYKNMLNTAIEMQLKTLVIPPMFVQPSAFPAEAACHLVLRTFRRYFDYFGPEPFVDLIVLTCTVDDALALYRKILPVYFPRNAEEEQLSSSGNISMDDGFGGPLIKERSIDIKVLIPKCDDEDAMDDSDSTAGSCKLDDRVGAASLLGLINPPPSDSSRLQKIRRTFTFGGGSSTPTKGQLTPPPSPKPAITSSTRRSSVMQNTPIVESAVKADLSAISTSGFLSVVGKDKFGRHIVVMVARELDLNKFELMSQVFLYFVRVLETIVSKSSSDYVFIYCHTACQNGISVEQASKLVKALADADNRYLERLSALYILHADWRTKASLQYAKLAVLPNEVIQRMNVINCCRILIDALLPMTPTAGSSMSNGIDALLPDFVVEFDNLDHQEHSS